VVVYYRLQIPETGCQYPRALLLRMPAHQRVNAGIAAAGRRWQTAALRSRIRASISLQQRSGGALQKRPPSWRERTLAFFKEQLKVRRRAGLNHSAASQTIARPDCAPRSAVQIEHAGQDHRE
jgi:hypothetical protein